MNDIYKYDIERCKKNKKVKGEDVNGCNFFSYRNAVVIFGYGIDLESKEYYWLIQNSWGHKHDINNLRSPLIKIKIGEIGLENILYGEAIIKRSFMVFYLDILFVFE